MKINVFLKLNNILFILLFNVLSFDFLITQSEFFSGSNYKHHKTEEISRIKSKNNQARQLVENAVKHFMKVSVSQACYDFIYNPVWRKGELYVFVIDEKGNCLAQGDDTELIWKNLSKIKTIERVPLVKQMLSSKKGRVLGYVWDHSYMTSYIKTVKKDGVKYALGAGFFPQNSEYTTKMMAQSAAAHFYAHGKEETFDLISQHNGPFAKGSIYTFAYDFDGICVAHGQNPALINQNILDMVNSKGVYVIKELLKVGQEKGKGWLTYYWSNDLKKSYVIKVVDPKTKKSYIIASGYYPNESFEVVKSFVNKAISYLKANGAKVAFPEFSNKVGQFVKGGLYIFAFDLKGKCLANGSSTGLVGQNLIKRIDQHGKYYVKDILRVAHKYKKGITSYYMRNAFTMAYVVEVQIPDGKFIIGSEYIPESKAFAVEGFVNKAIDYLENHSRYNAFSKFASKNGGFLQGDLSVFVYNVKGVRYANGFKKGQIWRNFSKSTDQNGKPVIEDLISTALNGGGWYTYKMLNSDRRVYVKSVDKDHNTYVIGSGFFL